MVWQSESPPRPPPHPEVGTAGPCCGGRAPRVTCLPSRPDFDSEDTGADAPARTGLSERSQAVGAVLSLLLVALTGCLLTLLLYKKERR